MYPPKKDLDKIDELIRSGQGAIARRLLRQIANQKIDRDCQLPVASLARRAGVTQLSLRLLNPLVRPSGKKKTVATDEEKAEYAAGLSFIGVGEEAVQILKSVQNVPQALLFRSFALFSQWDYTSAIPLLKQYLQMPISDYQRLVGRVNLAAALVHTRKNDEVDALLENLLNELGGSRNFLLYGNALELKAQLEIARKNWDEAEATLEASAKVLQQHQSRDQFFVTKWQTIVAFLKSPQKERPRLDAFRERARKENHWETLRHCDQFEAIALRNADLISHIYIGTPHPKFRERLLSELGLQSPPGDAYLWQLRGPARTAPCLDLATGVIEGTSHSLKAGQTLHRLICALSADFYRPLRVGSAYYALNPGDFYHPVHSPPRVYEAIRRLRKWFTQTELPLDVKEASGFYQLFSQKPAAIRITLSDSLPRRGGMILRVYQQWRETPVTVREASQSLGLSPRATLRLLTDPENKDWVVKVGAGPQTRYRVKLRAKS